MTGDFPSPHVGVWIYAVHAFRSAGLTVRAFEYGDGIGGTWYWNSYPGARCDIESKD